MAHMAKTIIPKCYLAPGNNYITSIPYTKVSIVVLNNDCYNIVVEEHSDKIVVKKAPKKVKII